MENWLIFAVAHDARWLAATKAIRSAPRVTARPWRASRECIVCAASLEGRRASVRYCSARCCRVANNAARLERERAA